RARNGPPHPPTLRARRQSRTRSSTTVSPTGSQERPRAPRGRDVMMNVLLVGLGRWGEKHVRVLREIGTTLWVADVSPERAAVAARRGAAPERAGTAYRRARRHVAGADIVPPADSHRTIAETALIAGRHCFVEKPLTVTSGDGLRLTALARERDRVLQPGH